MNAFGLHAAGHCRPDLPADLRSPFSSRLLLAGSRPSVLLENLGLPSCSVCLANWQRRAWLLDTKDVLA